MARNRPEKQNPPAIKGESALAGKTIDRLPTGNPTLTSISTSASIRQGPLPEADELLKYESIQAGFADRIMRMAEGQASHRHAMESTQLSADVGDRKDGRTERRIGQVFALIIGIVTEAVAAFAVYKDMPTTAATIGGIGAGMLLTAFLGSRVPAKDWWKPAVAGTDVTRKRPS